MIEVKQTRIFKKWLASLKDKRAKARILIRLARAKNGNLGDVKSVGSGLMEMRLPVGKGYRLYYIKQGDKIVLLLSGGDKSSQSSDIKKAQKIAEEIGREPWT